MVVIGVTGGVGTGKSTVARIFGELGAVVLDADRITHELLEPGTAVSRKIRISFGRSILDPRGKIHRQRLAEVAFSSQRRLNRLCQIIHPAVRLEIEQNLREIRRKRPDAVVVLDIPLLMEAGRRYRCDALVVASSSLQTAARRLEARSGWNLQEVRRRQTYQLPLKEKERKADFVVRNNGSLAATRRQVIRIWHKMMRRQRKSNGGRKG